MGLPTSAAQPITSVERDRCRDTEMRSAPIHSSASRALSVIGAESDDASESRRLVAADAAITYLDSYSPAAWTLDPFEPGVTNSRLEQR